MWFLVGLIGFSQFQRTQVNLPADGPLKVAIRARWRIFHWSGSQSDNSLIFVWGRFINSCVRYNWGSTSCRRQVLVKLARIAAVRPPRGLPTNKEFLRFSTTRFISRSETLLSIGTAPSLQKTFSSAH